MVHPYIYAGLPKAKMTYSEAYNYEKQRISYIFGISDFVTNKTRKRNYVWLRNWCYAFGFACRNYQLSTELSAKLTYSTCCTTVFILCVLKF